MSVKIRLTRVGAKKNPHYRLVVADTRAPRDGRFIEILGHFDPKHFPDSIKLDEKKVREWLDKGALPSETVRKLLATKGIFKAAEA